MTVSPHEHGKMFALAITTNTNTTYHYELNRSEISSALPFAVGIPSRSSRQYWTEKPQYNFPTTEASETCA